MLRIVLAAALAVCPLCLSAAPPSAAPYVWKNVQMVGGGFVDGIIFHPTAKGVRYARTDMGGAYRWNDDARRWEPILDWVPYQDLNLMGVESIAVDPSDPNRVYLSCGTYTNDKTPNGAVLRSSDRGRTFQRANVPFKMGGNENGRGNGERMAVDPNDGNIIYLGTRQAGLWRSVDRGVTWNRVESFPDVTEAGPPPKPQEWWKRPNGVVFVIFDPRSGSAGKGSSVIYAGASLMQTGNLFRSTDGGKTWAAVAGEPVPYRPLRAALASDGMLYITYGTDPGPWRMTNGGLWKLDTKTGAWTDITPDKPTAARPFGYGGVSVDAHNPRVLIVSSFYRPGGEEIFRSTNGGETWKPVFAGGGTYDFSLAPYVARTPIHWLFDIEIDPANPDHAIFTTGYGGYETFDLTDVDSGKPTKWSVMSTGIEETVALDLLSPPQGAHLLTAIGDYGGFVHWDLDRPAPEGNYDRPRFNNTNGLACAANRPEIVVRVGRVGNGQVGRNIGYSLDGGRTWQPAAAAPERNSMLGHIAVSSDGATWVWTPEHSAVSFTRDRGATWTASQGIPRETRVIADPVNPLKFYAIALFDGKLFTSSDGAATFTEQPLRLPDGLPQPGGNRGDDRGGQDRIYAAPGNEGDLWLAAFNGLYHSTDAGASFVRLSGVEQLHAFGFGKAAPDARYPALYMVGTVDGVRGIFRSIDTARTWVRINDDAHQWGLVLQITGDPKQYGHVYVGTHGRGTMYGDPR
jgi:photosystem II stability/assembly factor-like uncharacterized protein